MSSYTDKVNQMGLWELLQAVLDNPMYLTDVFFEEEGKALRGRMQYFIDAHHRMAFVNRKVLERS